MKIMKLGKSALRFSAPLAVVGALFLAGCGGGSDQTTAPPTQPPVDPEPSAAQHLSNLDSSLDALDTLSGAATADGSALKMATDAAKKIGTQASDGNSKAAMEYAQKVLGAKTALEAAIADAKTKLAAAKTAKAGLKADDPLLRLFNDEIERAEGKDGKGGSLKAADDVLKGSALRTQIVMVTKCPNTTTGCTGTTKPKTSADAGKAVANAIATALAPTSSDNGARASGSHGTEAPAAEVAAANKFTDNDATGMMWAMIGSNLVAKRVAQGVGTTTREVQAMKVPNGTKVSMYYSSGYPEVATTVADGTEAVSNIAYKGITGMLFCNGSDCSVAAPATGTAEGDRLLKGSWYFTTLDTNAKTYYINRKDDPTTEVDESKLYEAETLYATYGHWLTVNDQGAASINTFATSTISENGSWAAPDPASTDADAKLAEAKYSGTAAGRSVHKTTDGQGVVTNIQSGRFLADVNLTATFAATSRLGGTINNFRAPEGSNPGAVDGSWTVKLTETSVSSGAVSAGVADASGPNGVWSATSYGVSGKRPTGIYGGFNAHFTDGAAAGAFATRRKTE